VSGPAAEAPDAGAPTVIEAGPCDVALLAELSKRSFGNETSFAGTSWSARSLAEVLALPGSFGLLAVEAGQPVGFLLAQALFDDCEIHSLGVLAESRRAGHGRRLLRAAAAAAVHRGARRLLLEVAESNAGARAFYRAEGFAAVGRRRNYYRTTDGTPADAVICARSLDSGDTAA
jgi:ribosomal-protein-alanine N-acetyltransferase